MTPDYDRQVNPRWPNLTDTPLLRARRIASMYRAHLRATRPDLADQADDTAASFGETWMLDQEQTVEPDQAVTTSEAAQLVNVSPDTIRKWACLDHPGDDTQKLLPRFRKRGREQTYLAGKVLEAAAEMRRAQLARTRNLP